MPITLITNAPDAARILEKINTEIAASWVVLHGDLGRMFQKNVQDRIESENDGKWARASKWIQAKKGTDHKILEGAGKYVKYSADKDKMTLYGQTPGEWTLTDHHEGFLNRAEIEHDGRVTIDIVNPGPLGLSPGATKFSWVPRNLSPDKTPARQIWPTEEEVVGLTTPVYSRWLQATVNRATEGAGVTIQGSAL